MNKDCLTSEQYSIQSMCSNLPEIKWSGHKVTNTNMLKMAAENLKVKQPTLNLALKVFGLLGHEQNSRWEFVSFMVTDNE